MAAVHGAIRATVDADALVSVTASELGRIDRTVKKAGLTTERREGAADDPIPALRAIIDRHGSVRNSLCQAG
jgi:hypothetical protein